MQGSRSATVVTWAARFLNGWFWIKVVAWTLFALAGPPLFWLMRNYLGMAMTGAIAILIAAFVFGPSAEFVGRRELRMFLVAQGVVVGGIGAWMLALPPAPWKHVAASTRVSLALDATTGTVFAAHFGPRGSSFFVRDASGWQREQLPGDHVLRIALDRDGATVLAHEDRAPVLWLRDPGGKWRRVAGQQRTPMFGAAPAGLFATTGGPLSRFAKPDGPAEPVAGVDGAGTVCSGGRHVVAVRSSGPGGGGRLWHSDDDGAHFVEIPEVSLRSTLCAVSDDGTIWIAAEGLFAGELAVATASGAFVERSIPAPRIEALVVDPADGNHGWIGTWGGGVHRTRDGGEHWESMGLAGSEVSALVVDFTRNIAWAGTGSGVFELSL